jgi:hypothetical protein
MAVPHDDAIHLQATVSGDYADEVLYDQQGLTVSLIHFADGSHSVRLDLFQRGISMVLDTPAWLDLDTALPEVSADEPAVGYGHAAVNRSIEDEVTGYQVTIQGGDVVGRVSVILLEPELATLREALEASRGAVEEADELDHQSQMPGDGVV